MLSSPKFTGAFTGFIPRLSHIPQFITRRQPFFDPGCGARLIKVTVVVDFSSIRGGFPSFTRDASRRARALFSVEKKMLLLLLLPQASAREDLLTSPNRDGINFYIRRSKAKSFLSLLSLFPVGHCGSKWPKVDFFFLECNFFI